MLFLLHFLSVFKINYLFNCRKVETYSCFVCQYYFDHPGIDQVNWWLDEWTLKASWMTAWLDKKETYQGHMMISNFHGLVTRLLPFLLIV